MFVKRKTRRPIFSMGSLHLLTVHCSFGQVCLEWFTPSVLGGFSSMHLRPWSTPFANSVTAAGTKTSWTAWCLRATFSKNIWSDCSRNLCFSSKRKSTQVSQTASQLFWLGKCDSTSKLVDWQWLSRTGCQNYFHYRPWISRQVCGKIIKKILDISLWVCYDLIIE